MKHNIKRLKVKNLLMNSFIKNRKGTAEVIGTIMFIIIMLFFFTNVYLWHDTATKDANQLYLAKINSPITVSVMSNNPYQLNVTNKGGMDATLSMLWIDVNSSTPGTPDPFHGNLTLNNIVPAGSSRTITWTTNQIKYNNFPTGTNVIFKVITTVGNQASCPYQFK